MPDPIDFAARTSDQEAPAEKPEETAAPPPAEELPSNEVYARVGDLILYAARNAVRRGTPPDDIIRDIRREHGVHLTVGELRLLLATRRVEKPRSS